jgi:hypothetical protein
MVQYVFTTADITSQATNNNVLAGDRVQQAPYPRVLQGIAVVGLQNTPAVADWNVEIYAGPQLLASCINIVGRTTGSEVVNPDDFTPIGMVIPANAAIQVKCTDTDSATHNARIYFLLDRI